MLIYPEDFIKKVKDFYPNNVALHELLEKGDPFVGNLIGEDGNMLFQAEDIIQMFSDKKENKILEMAQKVRVKKELFLEWNEIFQKSL